MMILMTRLTLLQVLHNQLYEEATSASETESDLPVDKQKTYLIFESALLLLFSICFMCRSTYMIGSFLRIKQICKQCNNIYVWESQPYVGKIPAGNILLYFILDHYLQNLYGKPELCRHHKKDFFRHQSSYLQPAINYVWEKELGASIKQLLIKKQGLVLGGDGRADSPGHSAKYGSYSVIDLNQNKVLGLKLVQVWLLEYCKCMDAYTTFLQSNEVKGSYHMEKEGLHRCMNFLKESKLKVDVLVTDRHKQINKWLKDIHPTVKHYYDIWHIAKGSYILYV